MLHFPYAILNVFKHISSLGQELYLLLINFNSVLSKDMTLRTIENIKKGVTTLTIQ